MSLRRLKFIVFLLFTNPTVFWKKLKTVLKKKKTKIANRFFKKGNSFAPQEVFFSITAKCNLRCPMCGQWGDTGNQTKGELNEELSFEQLKKTVDEIAPFNPIISIWGGEPFLRKDLFDFIRYIKEKGLICNVITNGTLLDRNPEAFMDTGIDCLFISVDGPEAINDQIRGKGTFQKSIRGIQRIQQLKAERKSKKPGVEICTVIMEQTYMHMEELVHIAIDLGIDCINFAHAWSIPENIGIKHTSLFKKLFGCEAYSWKGFLEKPHSMDIDKLINTIERIEAIKSETIKTNIKFMPNLAMADIKEYYTNFHFTINKKRCYSPWIRANIGANGDVAFCLDYPDYKIGNVKDNSFNDIWNSEKARDFRKQLQQFNKFPICNRCCQLYID